MGYPAEWLILPLLGILMLVTNVQLQQPGAPPIGQRRGKVFNTWCDVSLSIFYLPSISTTPLLCPTFPVNFPACEHRLRWDATVCQAKNGDFVKYFL